MKETKFDIRGNLGDEDDAQTLSTWIPQRKRTIPHSTMQNMMCVVRSSDGAPVNDAHFSDCTL